MSTPIANADALGAAGAAVCNWIISPPGWEYRECGRPATQYDPDATAALCDCHAEEYAQVFGFESLRSIETVASPNTQPSGGTNHQ